MKIASEISKRISPVLFRVAGIDIFRCRRWIEQTENWTCKERNEWRLQKLAALIEHCWDNVPFYRELWSDYGVKIKMPREIDELQAFPIVTRDMYRENRERIIADNLKAIPHKDDATGGTTGAPLKYKHDLSLHALRYGFSLIGWDFAGYKYGDEVCVISGGALIPGQRSLRNRVRTWLERGHGVSCVGMNEDVALACYDMIEKYNPVVIHGYPSMISEFCDIMRGKKKRLYAFGNLKAVITTAEVLYPQYRKLIEDTLRVPVFDHYGCNDGGLASFECELHNGFHYNDLESIIEVKSPDESGIGPLVITNLWNRSMPFIRYENGDQVSLGTRPCPCGRIYPLIQNVHGRTGDVLRFSNGKSLGAPGLTLIFKRFPIDGWQVVQTGSNRIEIRIKSKNKLDENDEKYIYRVIYQHVPSDVVIDILYKNQLATTRLGKLKPVFVDMQSQEAVARN